jgi:hypothetical protein
VPAVEGYIAQRAEKAAAIVAGNRGLLVGMIEAACLLTYDGLSGLPAVYAPEERRKGIDLETGPARRALKEGVSVKI